ncbi:MAG: AEC family transporter [Rhodospirillales bacterium]|nr:AEC family transporter [Rhodospirillales bacterium]
MAILSTTGAIFAVIALGYLSVRVSFFHDADMRVFGKYVVGFALPALIFHAISARDVGEILNAGYLAAYLGGSLAVFAGGYAWSRKVSGLSPITSTFQSMGMACANSGFVGYPILLMVMPPIASTALALNMIVENLVMIPLVLALAEHASGGSAGGWPTPPSSWRRCRRWGSTRSWPSAIARSGSPRWPCW